MSRHFTFRPIVTDRILWTGLATLMLGTGPLIVWILIDPTANPVGPGILTFLTFWPAVLMIVVGLARGMWRAFRGEPAAPVASSKPRL